MMQCTIEHFYQRDRIVAIRQFRVMVLIPVIMLLSTGYPVAQPANNATKFLGNITTRGMVRSDFSQYWNHITGENECQWTSIAVDRGKMNWAASDRIASFAREQKITWTFHALLTSGSCPRWIPNLPDTAVLREIGQWMDSAAARYPDVPMITVINEGGTPELPSYYKYALGGIGVSGFDWIIKAFKMARERWPKALLIYNDYNNIEVESNITWTIDLLTALKQANTPIDIIGCEANFTQKTSTATLKKNIDRIAASGLPVYISAYEVGSNSDAVQDSIIREQFTMFWNHPKVIGITYWGYVVGQTGRTGTGLLSQDGIERPALSWLKNFVESNPNPPNDYPNLLNHTTIVNYHNTPEYMHVRTSQSIGWNDYRFFDLLGRPAGRNPGNSEPGFTQELNQSSGMSIPCPAVNGEKGSNLRGFIELR